MGKKMVYMSSCQSTNEVASDLMKKADVEEGTIVITNHQTRGRGQLGNSWEADEGKNITCSLILRPRALPIVNQFVMNVFVSLGVADAAERITSSKIKVKWPNDIYSQDEKLAGILINNVIKKHTLDTAIVGVGLNVNQNHFECGGATSLSLLSGNTTYDLEDVLEEMIFAIEKRYFQWRNDEKTLWQDYLERMYWMDEVRTFKTGEEHFTGIIKGVTKNGLLRVEGESGERTFEFKTIAFMK